MGIELIAAKSGNRVFVSDKSNNKVITLASVEEGNGVSLFNQSGKIGVQLSAGQLGNRVNVFDEQEKPAIELSTFASKTLYNALQAMEISRLLNGIKIYDEAGEIKWKAP